MHQRTWLSLLSLPLVLGFTYPMLLPRIQTGSRQETPRTQQDPLAGLADIQDVLNYVRENYVDPVDMNKVLAGGVEGALERAHPLNAYLTPEDLRLPDPGPADVGIRLLRRGLVYAVVLSVVPDSPAAKAGLLTGDVIRKVDGSPLSELTQPMLERRLRGPVGSSLTLLRYSVATGETKPIVLQRAMLPKPAISIRREAGVVVAGLPDLAEGRTEELRTLLQPTDASSTLLLDLRRAHGGSLEEATRLAASLGMKGPMGQIQEQGKADREIAVPTLAPLPMRGVASLTGIGTTGPAELLASALKKQKAPSFGDRTAALGVTLTRIPLRTGGAVEIVYQRWLGVGGERLDRQGVAPEKPLRGLRPEEDPIPKVLELMKEAPAAQVSALGTVRRDLTLHSRMRTDIG